MQSRQSDGIENLYSSMSSAGMSTVNHKRQRSTSSTEEDETGKMDLHRQLDGGDSTAQAPQSTSSSSESVRGSRRSKLQVGTQGSRQDDDEDEATAVPPAAATSGGQVNVHNKLTEPVFIDKNQQNVQRTDKSCQVCRDRRVKCGREWPICTRCKKRREPCTYGEGITVEVQDVALTEDPRIAQLQGKLASLEKQLKAAQSQSPGQDQLANRAGPAPYSSTESTSTSRLTPAAAAASASSASFSADNRRSISASVSPRSWAGSAPAEIAAAVQESLAPMSSEEADTLMDYLVKQSTHDHSLNQSDNLDWQLARPRMGELLTFHLLDASVFACCSRLVSFKPLISRIDYYKTSLHSLTPTDEAAVAVLCAIGARSSPHSAILGLAIPGLADGTASPAVYLSVGTRRESACRALSRRAQQVAWLGGVIEGASGWEGQALGPGLARTGTDAAAAGRSGSSQQTGARQREASSSTDANGVTDAESASASAGSSRTQARRQSRRERALLAKEKREAVEMLCGLSQVLIFDEVRPRKSRFFLRNAVGMFQDLQIDMDKDEVVELRRSVGLSLFGEDAVHSAQLLKPPLVSQADIDSHFAQTDLQLPDFDRDRLSQSLEEILSTNDPSEVSLPMLEKALWTTAIWVCYLQRTFAKLTTVRQPTMPSPLEQLQALWHQIDATHASVQKLQNYFVNIRHTPQGAEQDARATDHFVLLAVRADTRLVDIVFLMHGFLMREDVTSGWGLGTQTEANLVANMRVESEMRVRKCLKLVAFYSRLYLSSEDKHVVHHLTLQMELLPTWTFMAVQTVGQPGGPVSSEFEVSNEELDWLLSALRLALFYTPLAAVRLQELTAGQRQRIISSPTSRTPSQYDSRQASNSPPSPWLPIVDQVQNVHQWQQAGQQQQQQQQHQASRQRQFQTQQSQPSQPVPGQQSQYNQQGQSQQHQYFNTGGMDYPPQDYNNPSLYPAPPQPSPGPRFQRQHSLSSLPEPSPEQFQAQLQQHQRNTQALNIPYTSAKTTGTSPGARSGDYTPPSAAPDDSRLRQSNTSVGSDRGVAQYHQSDDAAALLQTAYPSGFVFDAYGFPRVAPSLYEAQYHRQQYAGQPSQAEDLGYGQQQPQQQPARDTRHSTTYGNTSGHSAAPSATAVTSFGGVLPSDAFKGQSWMNLAFTREASSGAWGPDVRVEGTEATAQMVEDVAGSTEDNEGRDPGQESGQKKESEAARRWSGTEARPADPQATSLQMQWGQPQYDIQPPELW